ncbi:endonuclease/exonuclease/phosphatase family domain-containing protein 1 [Nematostella vectensis]|uniref:endonuclease/exonuclease/phosphatase family domain-containing protein 1 n=1 Tax=Nematostella vectensis TaxID=45351 RepID=UPI00138FFC03|nr:endonuclease/exonuclease/phosphatase family domain-containing protein 1 [Nematostella vectensis]
MGNKSSSKSKSITTAPEENEGANRHEEDEKREKIQKHTTNSVDLMTASIAELVSIGVTEELASRLTQVRGKLNTVSEVVSVLESSECLLKVECLNAFVVRKVDNSVVIERIVAQAKTKRSFSFGRIKPKEQEDPESGLEPSKKRRPLKDSSPDKGSKSDPSFELEDSAQQSPVCLVNVNTATEEELERIKGFGPAVSKNIVKHREEHGPFGNVEELIVIRGVSQKLLCKLEGQLTVGDDENKQTTFQASRFKLDAIGPGGTLKYKGRDVVRLMSWNLQCFNSDKASNEGVCEVICKTILENGVNIVVIQEIGDEDALTKIKDELNHQTLKGAGNGHQGQWECQISDVAGAMYRSREYNGFLWDASCGIQLKSSSLLEKPKNGKKQFARRPFLGFFKTKGLDFLVTSVHLKATGLDNEDIGRLQEERARMPDIITALNECVPDEKDMVVLGDFNLEPDEEDFDCFREAHLSNLIPHSSYTNISTSNPDGSKCYDNIWISRHCKDHAYTSRSGVFRSGMTHEKIPDGWKWGGVVSDHCPVWAEFFCDQDTDKSTGEEKVEDIAIESSNSQA